MGMARKKSKSTQAKIALTRLVEDQEVQKQLRTGALRLREAYSRAAGRPPSKAVGDKKLYAKLQEAGSAFGTASRRLRRKPEPEKHTGRKLAIGAALAGAAAFVVKKRSNGSNEATAEFSQPVATPAAPAAATPAPVGGTPATPVPAA